MILVTKVAVRSKKGRKWSCHLRHVRKADRSYLRRLFVLLVSVSPSHNRALVSAIVWPCPRLCDRVLSVCRVASGIWLRLRQAGGAQKKKADALALVLAAQLDAAPAVVWGLCRRQGCFPLFLRPPNCGARTSYHITARLRSVVSTAPIAHACVRLCVFVCACAFVRVRARVVCVVLGVVVCVRVHMCVCVCGVGGGGNPE